MKKLTIICLAAVAASTAFVACNSDYTPAEITSTNVVVKSFALTKDDSVLANLDTVFFSIDLQNGRIFNADSLPYGTKTDKLIPRIGFYETMAAATLTVKRADGTDTIYNYLTNSTDSIDFSNGPVILDVVSPSGMAKYSYSIQVNVHAVKTDSLVWSKAAVRPLATNLNGNIRQRTVCSGDKYYTLATDGAAWTLGFADAPDADWTVKSASVPAGADVTSFAGGTASLYILADGTIWRSTDGGASWTDTRVAADYIYGCYEDRAVAVKRTGSTYDIVEYPAASSRALPAGMPVSGTSVPVTAKYPMASGPQMVVVGGILPDGTRTGASWAYDGSTWACISSTSLPEGLSDLSVVPFFAFTENKVFVATRHSVLLAMGGRTATGNSDKVYISYDFGMTWEEGSELIQLPDYIAPFHGAQAYMAETTMTSRAACEWIDMPVSYRLPATVAPVAASRAIYPVTDWSCYYIYLFGGVDASGATSTRIWRGTLNRFTFKPIQ